MGFCLIKVFVVGLEVCGLEVLGCEVSGGRDMGKNVGDFRFSVCGMIRVGESIDLAFRFC